jgi:hypothetical protein
MRKGRRGGLMAFNLADMVNKRPKQVQQENTSDTVYRDVFELVPSKENFYGTDPDRLRGLKNSIQLFGVMQDVLIEDVNGEDHIISGHCRTMCCRMLVEEGHEEFRKINCKYTTVKDDTRKMLLEDGEEDHETTQLLEKLAVIQANRFREKTDWEKMKEALETEEIIKGLRELTELKGKTRDMVRETIGVSGTQMERYHAVQKKLSPEWMKEFQSAKVNITVARELADLDETYQKKAMEHYKDHDGITGAEIKAFKSLQENNRDIPGQFTIEQATGQQRPPENDTPVQPELQIERFFEALNKGERERVLKCDTRMAAYLISIRYRDVRIRNGHFNYQANKEGITFNPDSTMQHSLAWNELSEELVKRFGKKQKPVKMVSVDDPEEPQRKLTESAAVKALCEAYPKKLKTIMRICRRCKDNGEAAKAVQLEFAPGGFSSSSGSDVNYSFMSFTAGLEIEVNSEKVSMKYGRLIVEAKNLYDPFSPEFDIEPKKPEVKDDGGPAKCITGQSGSGLCGAAAYCSQEYHCCSQCPDDCNSRCGWILEKSCQSEAETPDKKQQEDHFVEANKMVKHLRNTDKIPDAWPEDLKDIPVPTDVEIIGYLYDEERRLKEFFEAEKEDPGLPHMTILKQQLIVGGLRIIKNLVEDCKEEPEESEQPPLPIMRNNDQRKEWLKNYKAWGLWYTDNHTDVKYYKYDFQNGARLIVEEYAPNPGEQKSWWVSRMTETYYMHLVGGPEPDRVGGVPKWTYHARYDKFPNSETELCEFLKGLQK